MGMLLQAEWKPHLQCFVRRKVEEPNESDGFVWPAPVYEFYDRDGREITGKQKAAILKHQTYSNEASWSAARNRVFSPSVFSNKVKTATEVSMQMEEATKRIAGQIAKEVDDHFMDALMYGQSAMKVMRPGLNVTKVPTV